MNKYRYYQVNSYSSTGFRNEVLEYRNGILEYIYHTKVCESVVVGCDTTTVMVFRDIVVDTFLLSVLVWSELITAGTGDGWVCVYYYTGSEVINKRPTLRRTKTPGTFENNGVDGGGIIPRSVNAPTCLRGTDIPK